MSLKKNIFVIWCWFKICVCVSIFFLSKRTYKDKSAGNSEVLKSEYGRRYNKTFFECSTLPKLFFIVSGLFSFFTFLIVFAKGFYLITLFFLKLFWSCKTELCHCVSIFCLTEDFSFWFKNKQNPFFIMMLNQLFMLISILHTKYSVINYLT